MARLPIKTSVLSRLFAMSGNLCAYPSCPQILYREDGTGFVNICHIHAVEEGWTRYDPDVSDEALRAIDNLVLMCRNHHGEIDQEFSPISADQLREWKRQHEAKFTDMRLLFDPKIVDRVAQRSPVKPLNMGVVDRVLPDHFRAGDLAEVTAQIGIYVDKIKNIPPPTLEFMIKVIRHGLRGASQRVWGSSSLKLDANEVAQAFDLSGTEINDFCNIMERYGVGYLQDDYPPAVSIAPPADYLDWPTLSEVLTAVGGDLEVLLQGQDFSVFDT
nr:HNH endonuclease signature motif containing protein [uncultured Brevundimonas sp.]